MMDPKLLGLALQNAQGGYDAFLKGQSDAMKAAQMEREAQVQMMDLALKNSLYEPRRVIEFGNMLKSVSAPNEGRIQQGISLATDPFSRVGGPQSLGQFQEDPTVTKLREILSKPKKTGYATDQEIGVGGKQIKNSYNEGPAQAKPKTRDEIQQLSIDKLRQPIDRAPQSVSDSIVQPLEGDVSPYQNPGVTNLEPQVIRGNPDEEMALNHVMGKLADLNNPEYEATFSALNNPVMQRKMIGAMFKAGYVPGLGVQTEATEKRLSALDQGQIMAAKTSTQMNEETKRLQLKLEEERVRASREELMKMQSLVEQSGNEEAKRMFERSMKEVDQKIRLIEAMRPPAPRKGGSAQDPLEKAYVKRLEQFEGTQRRFMAKLAGDFQGLDIATIKELVQADPQDLADYNILAGLWKTGAKYPAARSVFEDMFRGSYQGDLNSLFGGGGGKAAQPSGGGGPVNGQEKTLKSGTVVVFDGSQWVPKAKK